MRRNYFGIAAVVGAALLLSAPTAKASFADVNFLFSGPDITITGIFQVENADNGFGWHYVDSVTNLNVSILDSSFSEYVVGPTLTTGAYFTADNLFSYTDFFHVDSSGISFITAAASYNIYAIAIIEAAPIHIDILDLSLDLPGDLTITPIPAALPLFATGLGALGLLGWRRKRKGAAIAA